MSAVASIFSIEETTSVEKSYLDSVRSYSYVSNFYLLSPTDVFFSLYSFLTRVPSRLITRCNYDSFQDVSVIRGSDYSSNGASHASRCFFFSLHIVRVWILYLFLCLNEVRFPRRSLRIWIFFLPSSHFQKLFWTRSLQERIHLTGCNYYQHTLFRSGQA